MLATTRGKLRVPIFMTVFLIIGIQILKFAVTFDEALGGCSPSAQLRDPSRGTVTLLRWSPRGAETGALAPVG